MLTELLKEFLSYDQHRKQLLIVFFVAGFYLSGNIVQIYNDLSEIDIFRIFLSINMLKYFKSLIYIAAFLDFSLFLSVFKDSISWFIKKDYKKENLEELLNVGSQVFKFHGWVVIALLIRRLIDVIINENINGRSVNIYDIFDYVYVYVIPLTVLILIIVQYNRKINSNL